ncbi:MAG: thiamine pyrophosphate-dependent dehydrogenase E1 component subunit alpha [Candidatus Omnitrophica bacterium]|nr:thiamine pyrophosphate-dependent dehydrogenase E1 component subunit alpha [Candidatus Omnitrophota bacterium]
MFDQKKYQDIYRTLYLIRRVEEEIGRIYPSDKIKSPVHLSIGQEAVSVAVCSALDERDAVFATYRSHAAYLAKGGNLKEMIAELYGKQTGCAKGKGGSMHLLDPSCGFIVTSAIVATTIPLAVGYAYSLKLKKSDSVVVVFFGDGAVDEGAFHESLNFAALKKLPVLFVCENNLYAIHSHFLTRHHSDNIFKRAASYGMASECLKEDDLGVIYQRTKFFVDQIRQGSGPAFLECYTCRWREHVGPNDDFHLGYRSEQEVSHCKDNDQLKKIRAEIEPSVIKKINQKVEQQIEDAFIFAEKSPFPGKEELMTDVFKD